MAKPQHEPRRAEIAGDANDSAVDGPVALDLNPITPATCHVWPINALGDHPFETGHLKPGFCHLDVGSVRHELEARMARQQQSLEHASPLRKRQSRELVTRQLDHVKNEQDGRPREPSRFRSKSATDTTSRIGLRSVRPAGIANDPPRLGNSAAAWFG